MVSLAERARAAAAQVVDPEIPVLTIADLGVLRDVVETDGRVEVRITPTYSGCPAMNVIAPKDTPGAGPSTIDVTVAITVTPSDHGAHKAP